MIKVLFFARVREDLGLAGLEIPWHPGVAELDSLQAHLCTEHGQNWLDVLGHKTIIRAVNQVVIAGNTALSDGDEVAFFPPVTGG